MKSHELALVLFLDDFKIMAVPHFLKRPELTRVLYFRCTDNMEKAIQELQTGKITADDVADVYEFQLESLYNDAETFPFLAFDGKQRGWFTFPDPEALRRDVRVWKTTKLRQLRLALKNPNDDV
jgi:hypothetical protein